jgi:nucleoside-diphosphate-sugar epimerase
MGFLLEMAWRILRKPGQAPISRAFVRLTGQEFTVSDGKARRELGYTPVISRSEGLDRLRASD